MFLTTAFRRLCSLQHHTLVMFPSLLSSCAFLFCSGLSLRLAFPSTSNLCFRGRLVSTPTVAGSHFVQVRPGRDRAILQYSCISGLPCAVSLSHSFRGSLSREPHSCAARRADAGPHTPGLSGEGGGGRFAQIRDALRRSGVVYHVTPQCHAGPM